MNNKEKLQLIKQVIENLGFNVHEYREKLGKKEKLCGLELETWTDYGVNMIEFLDFRDDISSIYNYTIISEKIHELENNFDIDEEIDIHRQDERYKKTFSITQSVYDFEKYADLLDMLAENFNNNYEQLEKEKCEKKSIVLEDSIDLEV